MRSAITPPNTPKSKTGRNCRATTKPRAVPLPVSFRTNQACATVCIQVPHSEIDCPIR